MPQYEGSIIFLFESLEIAEKMHRGQRKDGKGEIQGWFGPEFSPIHMIMVNHEPYYLEFEEPLPLVHEPGPRVLHLHASAVAHGHGEVLNQ